jgi:tetratricopeptide (TPR) repeat protein
MASFFLTAVATFVFCVAAAAQSGAQPTAQPLASADAAMQAGRFAEAARDYEAWLKAHPDSKEVLFALGVCYVQLGRQTEAVPALRRYVKLAPKSATGHAALGVALLDGASTAEAEAELKTALRLNPKQADAAQALARIYLTRGNADAAVALLRPLATSEDGETRTLLADALVKAGQPQEAAAMLEQQLTAKPDSPPDVYAAAGWAHLKAGDLAQAAGVCERGMRLYPESEIEAVYLALPGPLLAERIGQRVERLQQAPDVAELIALGRVLTDADTAGKTRANEIAQKMLAHAVELAPENASAHYNYGRALRQKNPEAALAEWEKALSLGAEGELRLLILTKVGTAKQELSDFDGAERAFREAVEVNRKLAKRSAEPALEYARFLQSRSRAPEAEALVDEALAFNPLSLPAHVERAKLQAARGQWDKVVETGEFVLRNAGEDEELLRAAHALLARAYLRLNQSEKAEPHRAWLEAH